MDLQQMATEMFMNQLGSSSSNVNQDAVSNALGSLIGSGDKLDLGGLVAQMSQQQGMDSALQSWLGDGANQSVLPAQMESALGESEVGNFSNQLGLDQGMVSNVLAQIIPELINQNSSGGKLLQSVGGLAGLAGLAAKFFRR